MATFSGNDGVVKVGTATVAEVKSFTVEEAIALVDDTAMGDDWDSHIAGRKSWSGTIECHWDDTDTTGQEALTIGASVTLALYPEGADAGDDEISGTATITSVSIGADKENSTTSRSFAFTGNGATAHSTA